MKTRNGFVSNSSSSSFVILSTKESLKAALDTLDPKARKFIKSQFVMSGDKKNVTIDDKKYELRTGVYYNDEWPIECDCDSKKCRCGAMTEEEIFENIKLFEKLVKPICFISEY